MDSREDDFLNEYEQRKQDRIDRYRERADKARTQSDALFQQSTDMASGIPVGQPIHGAADRRYRDRIMGKMEKSFAAMDKAEYYERKAQAAENNTAISSDDPQAIEKLTARLEGLKKTQEHMKAVNAYYRKHGTCHGMEGLTDEQAERMDQAVKSGPSFVKVPYSPGSLSSNNQEIHRTQGRIEKLTQAQEIGFTGWEFEGGRVEANKNLNRLQIFFDEIPDEETRRELKSCGFKWARSQGAWQRQLNDNAIRAASYIKAIQPTDGSSPTKIQPQRKGKSGPTR